MKADEARKISSLCANKPVDIEFDKILNKIKQSAEKGYTGIRENITIGLKYKARLIKLGYSVCHEKPFKTDLPVSCDNVIISWAK